ncbi:hypothetical protein HEB94_001607 [Actinopolymorpha pittospori]|uniref:Uncharacterized protein n=1 Tax=Actinopolymorpha pittospori TaxID=648752 RepID=A0A927R7Y9_9ACTN|nr:hypothetical protein [Actinopolymorpha pittospori]
MALIVALCCSLLGSFFRRQLGQLHKYRLQLAPVRPPARSPAPGGPVGVPTMTPGPNWTHTRETRTAAPWWILRLDVPPQTVHQAPGAAVSTRTSGLRRPRQPSPFHDRGPRGASWCHRLDDPDRRRVPPRAAQSAQSADNQPLSRHRRSAPVHTARRRMPQKSAEPPHKLARPSKTSDRSRTYLAHSAGVATPRAALPKTNQRRSTYTSQHQPPASAEPRDHRRPAFT